MQTTVAATDERSLTAGLLGGYGWVEWKGAGDDGPESRGRRGGGGKGGGGGGWGAAESYVQSNYQICERNLMLVSLFMSTEPFFSPVRNR